MHNISLLTMVLDIEITTAVNIEWLLDDTQSFPVVIDPTVGTNTQLTDLLLVHSKRCLC